MLTKFILSITELIIVVNDYNLTNKLEFFFSMTSSRLVLFDMWERLRHNHRLNKVTLKANTVAKVNVIQLLAVINTKWF